MNDTDPSELRAPISERRDLDAQLRQRLDALQGDDRELIPLVNNLIRALSDECAQRRIALRTANQTIKTLQAGDRSASRARGMTPVHASTTPTRD
ncbi:hypothetical protein [Microbacterium sp. NPDC087589]|uniref:hypothetical protein n=1 Tax=Microbacterium sp. NPDC087589 TaxID=3364191 RepID=UPI0037FF1268